LTVLMPGGFCEIVSFPGAGRIVVRDFGMTRIWDLDRRAPTAAVEIPTGLADPALSVGGSILLVWGERGGSDRDAA
jgi:hypothetical protein